MQFPCVCILAAVLAGSPGNEAIPIGKGPATQVAVDHTAAGHIVRRDTPGSRPTPEQLRLSLGIFKELAQSLGQMGYLPQEKRNETGLKDWYSHLGKKRGEGLSDDIAKALPSNDKCLLLDVGANVGAFTDDVISQRPNCKIIAFEPVQEIYSFNLDNHQAESKLTLENIALSDAPGPKIIYRAKSSDLGANSFQRRSPDAKPEKVTSTTLDKYADAHGLLNTSVSAIRIDVSGSEWRVLRGMHMFLQSLKHKPVISMKIDKDSVGSSEWKEEVSEIEWLFANGYQRNNYTLMATEDVIFWPNAMSEIDDRIVPLGTPLGWAMMRVWSGVLGTTAFLVIAIYCMAVSHKRR